MPVAIRQFLEYIYIYMQIYPKPNTNAVGEPKPEDGNNTSEQNAR